jgi:ribosomal protein L7/L12
MIPLLATVLDFSDYIILAAITLVCVGISTRQCAERQRADIRRLERKVDAFLEHLGIPAPSNLSEEVKTLARDPQRKVSALLLHRQQTGLGLSEAKSDIEAFIKSNQ